MASLSRVATSEAFVLALEKSGLLAADALAKIRQSAAATSDPKALARDLVKAGTLTRWQAGQLLHGYYLLVVGQYKLLDQLGSGETGRVYLAEHAQIQRRHAIKILSRRHAAQPEVLKRFLADAERVCALDHRNLSHVYDVNQDGDKYFLVMEYVEGQDLQKRVEGTGPIAPQQAAEYVRQAAEGLAHAHRHGVFHGDLNPTNLVLDASGTLKITDIGQARLVQSPPAGSGDETTEAAALATAVYRAPEIRGGQATADTASDVYSLGNVLCCLLTGRPAGDAADAQNLLDERTSIPQSLTELCVAMLAENAGERPAAMSEILTKLATVDLPAPTAAAAAGIKEIAVAAKRKKPLVAKAIQESADDVPAVVAEVEPAEAVPAAADPMAGFSLKVNKNGSAKRPAAAIAARGSNGKSEPIASPANRSRMPLIIGGAIGGGVLVLGLLVLAVFLAIHWASGTTKSVVADAKKKIEKAAANTPADKSAAKEANPAAGPESNPESNPVPIGVATTAPGAFANPLTPPMATSPPPMPAKVTPLPEGPPPIPAAAPAPATPAQPAASDPANTTAEKPAADKLAAETPAPTPPALAAGAPGDAAPTPAVAQSPLAGFPKAVPLPKLEAGQGAAAPSDALAPVPLGPCRVDDKALVIVQLKGGDGAIRTGKQKFELAAADGGTALRDWEISLTGGATPAIVALLSVKENQLLFQWTPEGAKQPAAQLLCNCGLHLSAGRDQRDVALRTPIIGQPLAVGLERAGSTVKWNIDSLPDSKKVFVEITRLEGGFPKHKFKERNILEGSDRTEVWTGSTDEAMPLGLRMESTVAAQAVTIKASPQYQLKAMAKPKLLLKKDLGLIEKQLDSSRFVASRNLEAATKAKVEQQQNLSKLDLEKVNEADAQLKDLKALIEDLDGKAKIHFRVYYQTDDGPIDLLVTEEAAADKPADESAPKDDAKPEAEPAAK